MKLVCKLYPGGIISKYTDEGGLYYLDQFIKFDHVDYPENPDDLTWDDGVWIYSSRFRIYLRDKYNLTPQMYYQIMVAGELGKDPICPFCNKRPLKWTYENKLITAYQRTCGDEECLHKLMTSYLDPINESVSKMTLDERRSVTQSARDKLSELYKDNKDDPEWQLKLCRRSAKMVYSSYLKSGNLDDQVNFYIASYKDDTGSWFKYGVGLDLEHRQRRMNYTNIKSIKSGTRAEMAKLEYDVKMALIPIRYTASEWMTWDEVYLFINEITKLI